MKKLMDLKQFLNLSANCTPISLSRIVQPADKLYCTELSSTHLEFEQQDEDYFGFSPNTVSGPPTFALYTTK